MPTTIMRMSHGSVIDTKDKNLHTVTMLQCYNLLLAITQIGTPVANSASVTG